MTKDPQVQRAPKPLTGRKALAIFVGAFGVIISVNLVLAYNAVRSFPGLEVANSYVASQSFDADRAAQESLGWQASVRLVEGGMLRIALNDRSGLPAAVDSLSASIGRPTERGDDKLLVLDRGPSGYDAAIDLAPGKWHLWLEATSRDGTAFRQRLTLIVAPAAGGRR